MLHSVGAVSAARIRCPQFSPLVHRAALSHGAHAHSHTHAHARARQRPFRHLAPPVDGTYFGAELQRVRLGNGPITTFPYSLPLIGAHPMIIGNLLWLAVSFSLQHLIYRLIFIWRLRTGAL
jgi:hypothetical protein